MKKSILLLIVTILFFACKTQKYNNILLPKQQIVVHSFDLEKEPDLKIENAINLSNEFLKSLIDKTLDNDITVYSPQYLNDFYRLNELTIISVETLESFFELGNNQNIESYFEEIKSLIFAEEWIFDAEKFTFKKNVLSYTPVRYFSRNGDDIIKKRMFRVLAKNQKTKDKKMLLQTAYEYNFNTEKINLNCSECLDYSDLTIENSNSPYLSSHARSQLYEALVNQVLANKTRAYNSNMEEKLSDKDFRKQIGMDCDTCKTLFVENSLSSFITPNCYSPVEIKSLIFIEKWYYSPKDFNIVKEVIGLAPVRHYIFNGKETKQALFVVFFDD